MFNRQYFENSQPDGIGVLEIAQPPEGRAVQPRLFVPLRRTELRGEVAGPLADLRLIQTFGYTRAQCALTVEAIYRFPLPGDAAVVSVRVRFGDVEIEAGLKERRQAEAEYEEAKQQGQQAALATRESPDVFTLQVAGLQPDQDIVIETHYVQMAKAEGAGWSLRIPLTTSPRYVRSDEAASPYAQGQPLLLLRDPGHRFALDLLISGAATVRSPTHALTTSAEGRFVRVQLRDGEVLPDRDCLLNWEPPQEERRPALLVLTHRDVGEGQVYFLALATPPALADERQLLAREAIVLVDHSGSMEGPKWEAADWAVKRFLLGLRPEDAVSLCLFHTSQRWFAKRPGRATEETVAKLITFLEEHKDSGGTELGVALEQALAQPRTAGIPARHVFIITDAEVSDAGRILRLADAEAARSERRRISVLCIDAAPNAFLANELAERGGGMARFLTSQPEEGDISTALDEIVNDWAAPVYANLRLALNRAGVESGGQAVMGGDETSAIDAGDLPAGRPRWLVGRVPDAAGASLIFRLLDSQGRELAAQTVDESAQRPALKALFGARRILGLEYLMLANYDEKQLADQLARLGYDPKALPAGMVNPSVYAENVRQATADALKGLLVSESLRYGLVSAETAFIAVRKEEGQPIAGTVPVANALPTGWSSDFLSYGAGVLPAASVFFSPPSAAMPAMGRKSRGGPRLAASMAFDSDDGAPPLLPLGRRRKKAETEQEAPAAQPLFRGTPAFSQGRAILFDSAREPSKLPADAIFHQLELRLLRSALRPADVPADLALLIYVEDLVAPRARIRLRDLLQQGGKRPLNIARRAGQPVRLVLEDPAGGWAQAAPQIEVYLRWR